MSFSVVLAVLIAMLIAAGVLWAMMSSSRPADGWRAEARRVLSSDREASAAERSSVRAERREALEGEGVSIATLLDEAEEASGYYTVPKRYEDRIESVAVKVVDRVGRSRKGSERVND